jgi:hypothetical protein
VVHHAHLVCFSITDPELDLGRRRRHGNVIGRKSGEDN